MKQTVYLSRTESGQIGLFTNGIMAVALGFRPKTYAAAADVAARYGFKFDQARSDHMALDLTQRGSRPSAYTWL